MRIEDGWNNHKTLVEQSEKIHKVNSVSLYLPLHIAKIYYENEFCNMELIIRTKHSK